MPLPTPLLLLRYVITNETRSFDVCTGHLPSNWSARYNIINIFHLHIQAKQKKNTTFLNKFIHPLNNVVKIKYTAEDTLWKHVREEANNRLNDYYLYLTTNFIKYLKMLYSLQTTNIHIMVFISFVCNISQLYELCNRTLELYSDRRWARWSDSIPGRGRHFPLHHSTQTSSGAYPVSYLTRFEGS